jgi:hypothetical protein
MANAFEVICQAIKNNVGNMSAIGPYEEVGPAGAAASVWMLPP